MTRQELHKLLDEAIDLTKKSISLQCSCYKDPEGACKFCNVVEASDKPLTEIVEYLNEGIYMDEHGASI